MEMDELLEKVKQQYVIKGEELNQSLITIGELKSELKQLKNEVAKREEEVARLKSRWDKAEKLFKEVN